MTPPRPARPRRVVPLTAAQRRRNRHGDQVASGLLFGMWAYVVGTPLLGRAIGVDLDMLGQLFIACLTIASLAVVVLWFGDLVESGLGLALALVAPACYVTARALYVDVVDFHGITVVAVTLALAASRPRTEVLKVVAVLMAIAIVGSIVLGFLRPELAIQSEGGVVTERADKQVLPGLGLLAGVAPHANTMGQLVALSLPVMVFIERLWLRATVIAVMGFALLWTAARGSIVTFAVVLVLMVLLPQLSNVRVRVWVGRAAITTAIAVCAALPWVLPLSDGSYSARGGIWTSATELWLSQSPLFGFGPSWFTLLSEESSSPIIGSAVTGHNQLVHLAVTGGFVLLVAAFVQTLTLVVRTTGARARYGVLAALTLTAIWMNGWLEYGVGYIDNVPTWPVTFPLLAVLLFARDALLPRSVSGQPQSPGRGAKEPSWPTR